jgi:hypothetical protein
MSPPLGRVFWHAIRSIIACNEIFTYVYVAVGNETVAFKRLVVASVGGPLTDECFRKGNYLLVFL